MLISIGLILLVVGNVLFLIPMVLNKWEGLARIGFLVFCVGVFLAISGVILNLVSL